MNSGRSTPRSRSPRRRCQYVAGIAAATLLAAACVPGSETTASGSDQVVLHFQELYSPGNAFADATEAYGDAVTESTDGAVQFQFHWSNSIVASDQVAGAMEDDLIDMARLQPPASPADFPVTNWLSRAAYQSTHAFPAGLLQQIGAHLEFALNSPDLDAELERLGVRYIAPLALTQQYDLFCSEPLDSVTDFQGTAIRTGGSAWVAEAQNLGAEPVTLLAEEIYEGFQRGIVDCVMTYPTNYVDSGLWELGGHYIPLSFTGWNQDAIAISRSTWDELSDHAREALLGEVRVWIEVFVRRQLEGHWRFATEGSEHGVEFAAFDPDLQAPVDDFHESLRDTLVESAPNEVADPEAVLLEYERLHDMWLGYVEELGYDVEGEGLQDWIAGLDNPDEMPDIDLDPWLDKVMLEAFGTTAQG